MAAEREVGAERERARHRGGQHEAVERRDQDQVTEQDQHPAEVVPDDRPSSRTNWPWRSAGPRAARMRYAMGTPGMTWGPCDGPDSFRRRAIGSAGERLVHTEEVTGSIPVSPTQLGGRFQIMDRPFVILVQQQSAAVAPDVSCPATDQACGARRGSRVEGTSV